MIELVLSRRTLIDRRFLLLLGLAMLVGAPIGANDSAAAETMWLPSFSVGLGVQIQDADGELSSTLRSSASGSEEFFFPVVPFGVELMGPRIDNLPGEPRPFVYGEWLLTLDSESTLAEEGDPGALQFPEDLSTTRPEDIGGQGSRFRADQRSQWFAGLGVAIPFDFMEQPLLFKPSVSYYGQATELSLLVVNVTGPVGGPFAEMRVSGDSTFVQHGLGPRLALEADAGSAGPLALSVFAEASVMFLLGDNDTTEEFSSSTGSGSVTYEGDSSVVHATVGVRFTWRGFEQDGPAR
jgi:hypothetical protein